MSWIHQMEEIITNIEEQLDGEIDYDELAKIMGSSSYHFQRIFGLMAGIPLGEYIRRRKMTKAAFELQNSDIKVVDLALKYGYQSPTAFNRAFQSIHGIAPNEARKQGSSLVSQVPISFQFVVNGTEEFHYKIEKKEAFRIVGVKLHTTMEDGLCYKAVPEFWEKATESRTPERLLPLMNGNMKGVMGVSDCGMILESPEFDYYIGVSSDQEISGELEEYMVSESTWAIFDCQELEQLQALEQRIVMDWLPASGYEYAKAPDIELNIFDEITKQMRCEVWLPVVRK